MNNDLPPLTLDQVSPEVQAIVRDMMDDCRKPTTVVIAMDDGTRYVRGDTTPDRHAYGYRLKDVRRTRRALKCRGFIANPEMFVTVTGIDTSGVQTSKATTNSYNAIVTILADLTTGNIYVRNVWRERCDFERLKLAAISEVHAYNSQLVNIEHAAQGGRLAEAMKGFVTATVCLETPSPQRSKEDRVFDWLPLLDAGQLFVPKRAPWRDKWDQEMRECPGKFMDQIDAFGLAVEAAKQVRGWRVTTDYAKLMLRQVENWMAR